MHLKLNDKTALVTAATAGIGLEIARKLAVEGASVTITGRDQIKLDASFARPGAADARQQRHRERGPTRSDAL